MAAQHLPSSNGGTPAVKAAVQPLHVLDPSGEMPLVDSAQLSTSERKLRLAKILLAKAEQGYRIESQTETEATLVTQGRRRWFGMVGSDPETRQITSIDEQGHTHTRPAPVPARTDRRKR
jgi:hypothetical protein